VSKDVAVKGAGKDAAKRDQTRTNKESGDRMTSGGHIGGAFAVTTSPAFLDTRSAYFDTLWAVQQAATAALQSSSEHAISVTLPDGSVKQGVAFKTSPYDIAKAISTGLADSIIIAKVCYSSRLDGDSKLVQVDDEADEGIQNKECKCVMCNG
jgi:threonyl-tRNA synthetase